jgi:hypothetical protein
MSFSYNENLNLGTCQEAVQLLKSMNKQEILSTIQQVAKQEVTHERLHKEFIEDFDGFQNDGQITGEHIKNYFAIGLEGVQKVLTELSHNHPLLNHSSQTVLYEDVFSFIDALLDEVDFELLFQQELLGLTVQ